MKYAIAASMMALGLAACGGGGGGGGDARAEFVSECVAESGDDKATCECQADAMIDAVGKDNFNKMANIAKTDEDKASEMMTELMTSDPAVMMKVAEAMGKCSGG